MAQESAHSHGSTVDLTIACLTQESASDNTLDMGSPFDFFSPIAHYAAEHISPLAQANRKYLKDLMVDHGFVPYEKEWWHFTLDNEPFPDTSFDFPVA